MGADRKPLGSWASTSRKKKRRAGSSPERSGLIPIATLPAQFQAPLSLLVARQEAGALDGTRADTIRAFTTTTLGRATHDFEQGLRGLMGDRPDGMSPYSDAINLMVRDLPRTDAPEPGDAALMRRPRLHVALVERVEGNTIHTIDADAPEAPGIVSRQARPRQAFECFLSVEPWLAETRLVQAEHELRPLNGVVERVDGDTLHLLMLVPEAPGYVRQVVKDRSELDGFYLPPSTGGQ